MSGLVQEHPTYLLKVGANSASSCLKATARVVDTAGASTGTPEGCINYGGNDDDLIEV